MPEKQRTQLNQSHDSHHYRNQRRTGYRSNQRGAIFNGLSSGRDKPEFCACGRPAKVTWREQERLCLPCFKAELLKANGAGV